jgi:hypothetical protein
VECDSLTHSRHVDWLTGNGHGKQLPSEAVFQQTS